MDATTFVARQPIFDQGEKVFAYELLFRCGPENIFKSDNPDRASVAVLEKLLSFGSNSLADGRRAFLNCTRDFLLKEYATLLPRKETVLEILENVEPDSEVLGACRRLKDAGYVIALDDFTYAQKFEPFIEITDIIKVDFVSTPLAVRKMLVEKFVPRGIRMLAEKVETREEFRQAAKMGYELFQGYFFCKPQMLPGRTLPAYKVHYLQILQAVSQPEIDMAELQRVIERDASLSYKLLRYVNSALFDFRQEVRSMRHALALMGQTELRKWASVAAMIEIAQDKPPELLVASLTRARFCEQVASKIGMANRGSEFFLTGLFSLMDAIVGRPLNSLLSEVTLPGPVKAALLGEDNRHRWVYELFLAYDQGRWTDAKQWSAKLKLSEALIPNVYVSSLEWVTQVFEV